MKMHPMKLLPCLAASMLAAMAAAAEPVAEVARPLAAARFVVPPEKFIAHTPERSFIGPGTIVLENGEILMAAPWGRPPTNFEQLAATVPVPSLYRSSDGGRTWATSGRMSVEWKLAGMVSDQGISFLRLKDGRLAAVLPRHVQGLHGGGVPAITFSCDDGATWSAAKMLVEPDDAYFVMNDRLIQLKSGRLLLPVARKVGKHEGDQDESLAMLSDDGGESWRLSRGRVRLLARTGAGFIYSSLSADGGESWSAPVVIDASGSEHRDRQNIYPSPCFTPEGMVVVWSTHGADPKGSFAGTYDAGIGGGKRAIIAF